MGSQRLEIKAITSIITGWTATPEEFDVLLQVSRAREALSLLCSVACSMLLSLVSWYLLELASGLLSAHAVC